jgi:hypothetical protein
MSRKKQASPEVIQLIRRLAKDAERVEVYRTAIYSFMGGELTKEDVCDAVCEWIDAGKGIVETTIHTIPEFKGTPAYELKPRLGGQIHYVKMAIEKRDDDWMLILSAHPD